jgi:hypothetical protein
VLRYNTDGNPNSSITQVTFCLDSNSNRRSTMGRLDDEGREDGHARRLGRRSYHSSSKEVTLSQAAK